MDKITICAGLLPPYHQFLPPWAARSDGNGEQEPVKMGGTAQIGHTLRSPA
jgi:hypothetical protein